MTEAEPGEAEEAANHDDVLLKKYDKAFANVGTHTTYYSARDFDLDTEAMRSLLQLLQQRCDPERLRSVDLSRNKRAELSLEEIAEPLRHFKQLQKLDLSVCEQVHGGLSSIAARLPHLKLLDLFYCSRVTGDLEDLKPLAHFERLNLHRCSEVGGTLNGLAACAPTLRQLSLINCSKVRGALSCLAGHTQLQLLDLSNIREGLEGDLEMLAPLAELRKLALAGCEKITGELSQLGLHHPKLQGLYLSFCHRVVGNVSGLAALTQLRMVDLERCSQVDGDLGSLSPLADLRTLNLTGCNKIYGKLPQEGVKIDGYDNANPRPAPSSSSAIIVPSRPGNGTRNAISYEALGRDVRLFLQAAGLSEDCLDKALGWLHEKSIDSMNALLTSEKEKDFGDFMSVDSMTAERALLPFRWSNDSASTLHKILRSAGGGLKWLHARLMVRGEGNAGKTTTIAALSGKEFVEASQSTVGASVAELELRQQSLSLQTGASTKGDPLHLEEHVLGQEQILSEALAAHATRRSAATGESVLSRMNQGKAEKGVQKSSTERVSNARKQPAATKQSTATEQELQDTKEKRAVVQGQSEAPKANESAEEAFPYSTGAGKRATEKQIEPVNSAGGRSFEEMPKAMPDLILRYQQGDRIILHVQDMGGQPVFRPILDMLVAPDGTVHIIVFSLPLLNSDRVKCLEDLVMHLRCIQAVAEGAPTILVGTRKDDLRGDSACLDELSAEILSRMETDCGKMLPGLVRCGGPEGLAFFPIENKKGFKDDTTIQELVMALDVAVSKLPCLSQLVPLSWLKVYEALRTRSAHEGKRWLWLDEVKMIARGCGLPHDGFKLEDEVAELLRFLHELSAVLWFEEKGLDQLVILDAHWLIDAATCIIRDFSLDAHSVNYARMKDLDERAKREVKTDWQQLTQGQGLLSPRLRGILWDQPDFHRHEKELLQLLEGFGLAIPVPGSTSHLIPPLLAEMPYLEWPLDAARFRVHFCLKSEEEDQREVFAENDLRRGFIPPGAFHCLAAGIMGSSPTAKARQGSVACFRSHIRSILGKEHVLISLLEGQCCIEVQLHSDGSNEVGAEVLDRFRVLLRMYLQQYKNVKQRLLVPLHHGSATSWVDLDMVMMSNDAAGEDIYIDGTATNRAALRTRLTHWLPKACHFYFIDAQKLREGSLSKMLTLQELQRDCPSWVIKQKLAVSDAASGHCFCEYLAVSHRWEQPDDPDPDGKQLDALVTYLRTEEGSKIRYVFYDKMSLPQGERTAEQKADFLLMLPNINILYFGATVLILADRSYLSRFWTQFEAWLAFQRASSAGLRGSSSKEVEQKVIVMLLHNAPKSIKKSIEDEWLSCSVEAAHQKLSSPDITVTNQSDKQVQLGKIFGFNEQVRAVMSGEGTLASEATPHSGSPSRAFRNAAASAAAAAADPLAASSLRESVQCLLAQLELQSDVVEKAMAWCGENGVNRLQTLLAAEMEEDLVEVLDLKKLPKKALLRQLEALKKRLPLPNADALAASSLRESIQCLLAPLELRSDAAEEKAMDWCEENGASRPAVLFAAEMEDLEDLVEALDLKKAPKRAFLKQLAAMQQQMAQQLPA